MNACDHRHQSGHGDLTTWMGHTHVGGTSLGTEMGCRLPFQVAIEWYHLVVHKGPIQDVAVNHHTSL